MSLYRVTTDKLEPVDGTSFMAEKMFERQDLQRMLRQDISPIGDDLMVIAEEYGEWEDSNRRIDLLCLSRSLQLVVVEIKRTEDGGHMELQALRYAAMVSSMTLDQVIEAYSRNSTRDEDAARNEVLEFLELESVDDAELTGEVRIVLVSANFSTEITTAVLWLNRQGLDITCIRLRPYRTSNDVLVDVTQIIPLPEAADYEVKRRTQEAQKKRKAEGVRYQTLPRFWEQLLAHPMVPGTILERRNPPAKSRLSIGLGHSGIQIRITMRRNEGEVECRLRLSQGRDATKAAFHHLQERQVEIEQTFGGSLEWQELSHQDTSRISVSIPGGWESPEEEWPEMQEKLIDAAVRLEAAFRQPIQELSV